MKIEVRTNKLEESEGKIKGFASIVFEDSFALNNITIRENNEGELYVMMPQMSTYKNNEKGIKERTMTDAFFPTTAAAREDISYSVLNTFNKKGNGTMSYIVDSNLEIGNARAYLMDKGNTKAKVSVNLGDFALPAVYVLEGRNGNAFLRNTATERTVKNKETNEKESAYRDNFVPITTKSGKEFSTVCLDAYHKALNGESLDLTQNNDKGR